MKKFISILSVFILLLNTGGYFVWYLIVRNDIHNDIIQEIRNEIKTNFSKNDLSLIVVSPENADEIFWLESEKEFEYRGEMYDVVKTHKKDVKTYYYCIKDVKEKQLISSFIKIRHSGQKTKKIAKILNLNFIFPEINSRNFIFIKNIFYFSSEFNFKATISDIPSPPPKLV